MPFDDTMPRPIGLTGLPGAGKSTVARALVRASYERWSQGPPETVVPSYVAGSFSGPLKKACAAMTGTELKQWQGATPESRAWRETPLEGWDGRLTPLTVMRHVGTEVVRALHPDAWVFMAEQMAQSRWKSGEWHGRAMRVVFDDVRFANEIAMIHRLGGVVVDVRRRVAEEEHGWAELMRGGLGPPRGVHASLWSHIEAGEEDLVFWNDESSTALPGYVGALLDGILSDEEVLVQMTMDSDGGEA